MTKILLIIEDYNETSFIQMLLRKLGFVVESNNNPYTINTSLLGFQPNIILVTAKGKKVNGMKMLLEIKKSKNTAKVIFIKKTGQIFADKLLKEKAIEGVFESPVNPLLLIKTISTLENLNQDELNEKYKRILKKSTRENDTVNEFSEDVDVNQENKISPLRKNRDYSKFLQSDLSLDKSKKQSYADFLKNMKLPKQNGLEGKKIKDFNQQLRKEEDSVELEGSNKNKVDFVDALFSLKK